MLRHVTCSMAALVVLAAMSAPATAQPNRSEFESHAWYTAIPERGAITCPGGGEPASSLLPPWCGGDRTKVRDRVLTGFIDSTSDERVAGTIRVVMNMNLDASYQGPVWGTYEIQVPGRGAWEGTWQGRSMEGLWAPIAWSPTGAASPRGWNSGRSSFGRPDRGSHRRARSSALAKTSSVA